MRVIDRRGLYKVVGNDYNMSQSYLEIVATIENHFELQNNC